MIIVNFKTYIQATGEQAVNLASVCREAAEETGIRISIAVQPADIFRIAQQIKIPIFGQHCDPVRPGRHTGSITASALKQAGASAVFFNHSEHSFFDYADLEYALELAKEQDLETLVFAKDLDIARKIDQFKPTYIALEEPAMVGGDKAMISLPENHCLIREFIAGIEAIPLIGAGIKTKEDVFNSLKLGIKGVVLASGLVKAKDPKQTLLSLASAF